MSAMNDDDFRGKTMNNPASVAEAVKVFREEKIIIGAASSWPRARMVDSGACAHWHLVHVAAKFERGMADDKSYVAKQIKQAGFEVYSARLRKMVTPRSQNLSREQRKMRHAFAREKIEPLFPRYEFVRFNAERDPWHAIFSIVGVYGMLCAGNLPVALPDAFVAGLRAREVNGAIPAETPAYEVFALGETVRIVKDGPFKGLTGSIGRLAEGGRISLLIALFGGATPADLTLADIEKL